MRYNKRSMSQSVLLTVIVVASVSLILISFSGNLSAKISKTGDIEACRLSVLAQAQTKTVGVSPISLDCERRKLVFYDDKVEINGKKTRISNYDKNKKELDEDIVNKAVAEELRTCWYKMGEGELDVFRQHVFGTGETACTLCTEIEFDESVKQDKFEALLDFLKGNYIPNSDISYFDFLIRSQRDQYLFGKIPWSQWSPWSYGTTDKIDYSSYFEKDKKYVIYFLGWKPAWLEEKTGAATSAYYIGLGEPEKAADECRRLVN